MLSLQFTYSLTQKLCPLFFCYKFNKLRTQMLAISQVSLCIQSFFQWARFRVFMRYDIGWEARNAHELLSQNLRKFKDLFYLQNYLSPFSKVFANLIFPAPGTGQYTSFPMWLWVLEYKFLCGKKKDTTTFLGISPWVFSRQPHPMTAGANC